MRSFHLVMGVSLVSALAAMGCSSSSSKGGPTDSGEPEDGGSTGDGAVACGVPITDAGLITSLTVPADAGDAGASLTCEQTMCMSDFTACAADPCCNSTIYGSLTCIEALPTDAGTPGEAALLGCFTTALQSANTNVQNLTGCLSGAMTACGLSVPEGGSDASHAPDGSSSTTDGSTTDGSTTDGSSPTDGASGG